MSYPKSILYSLFFGLTCLSAMENKLATKKIQTFESKFKSTNCWPHLCYALELFINISGHKNAKKILEKKCKKIENEKLLSFIEDNTRTDERATFYVGPSEPFNTEEFAFSTGKENIIITPEYYDILCNILEKKELQKNDSDALDIFKFVIHHEMGHIKNNDIKKRFDTSISISIASAILFELSKKMYNFKYSKLTTFLSMQILKALTIRHLCKKQEFRADDNAKDHDALKGGIHLFNNVIKIKKEYLEAGIKIKTASAVHPSPESRLARLENKLQALSAT